MFTIASNILNGIPVVGHVKAYVHLITGDPQAARRAMYESTRSSLVIGGGIVGLAGGPAGAIAGAVAGGALIDTVSSIASGRPQGIIESIDDIHTDISNGNVPVGPIVKAGCLVGADVVSGLGAGAITEVVKSAGTATGKSVAKTVMREVVKAAAESEVKAIAVGTAFRSVVTNEVVSFVLKPGEARSGGFDRSSSGEPSSRTSSKSATSGTSSSQAKNEDSAAGSGADQPPRDNENDKNKKDSKTDQTENHVALFLSIFNVNSLDEVIIGLPGVRIFRDLAPGQIKTLKKLIKNLRADGYLIEVIKVVVEMFKSFNVKDVTFQNFLSLVNLVASYIGENVARSMESQRNGSYNERRQRFINTLANNISSLARNIMEFFKSIRAEIEVENVQIIPSFRNIFSAIYHWYKHRWTPNGEKLSVKNYFDIIKRLLSKLKKLRQYSELINSNHPRREIVYEIFCPIHQRRIRIVVKVQDNHLELSSCYIVITIFLGDEDGDEFVDGKYRLL